MAKVGGTRVLTSAGVRAAMRRRMQDAPEVDWMGPVCGPVLPSDSPEEGYPWIGAVPGMKKWIGGRDVYGFRGDKIKVSNVHYEDTIDIAIEDMNWDKTGNIQLRTQELGEQPSIHWAELSSDLILNGETGIAYDDQYFFDTDHETGESGVQSNLLTINITTLPVGQLQGTATAENPAPEQIQQCINKGIQAILGFKNDRGKPMNEGASAFAIMSGVGLSDAILSAVTMPQGTTGSQQNVGGGLTKIAYTNVRLSAATTKFWIFRTDATHKAIHRQQDVNGVRISSKAEGSDYAHDTHHYQFGVDVWRASFYAWWQDAVQINLTVT